MSKPQLAAGQKNSVYYIQRVVVYAIFITFTILTIYPLFWLGYSSFKTNGEIQANAFAFAETMQWENYAKIWKIGRLGRSFTNSFIYFVSTIVLTLMSAMMAAYAFGKMRFKKTSKILGAFIGLGILISTHSVIIPLFMMLMKAGLVNTRIGVIMVYTAVSIPMALFIGKEYVKGLPDSLIESAYIDGASNFRMFFSIILPMCVPVMVTVGIVTGLGAWNEFLLGFIITGIKTRGLPPTIVALAQPKTPAYGMQFAALVIATVPIIVFYAIFNKRITAGVVSGAVKG